jgi:hypothetical protein
MKETEFMSKENQKKAAHYSLLYLNNEIEFLNKTINLGTHPAMNALKETLKQKLIVLQNDLKTFEDIYQRTI